MGFKGKIALKKGTRLLATLWTQNASRLNCEDFVSFQSKYSSHFPLPKQPKITAAYSSKVVKLRPEFM